MSHVLLGGDEHRTAELRFLLIKWGVTAGPLVFAGDCPTVHDCDVVILEGGAARFRDAWPDTLPDGPGGAVGPAAPLIYVNRDGASRAELPASWLVLDDIDQDGGNLRLALCSSLSRGRSLRGEPAAPRTTDHAADNYLHFLGHELRSPLTAIKTSLEVLEGELGGLEPAGSRSQPHLKMLGIALRNVRRLHRTVEWSQDLLARRDQPVAAQPRETAVSELAARLSGLGEVRVAPPSRDAELHTDADLIENLVQQMGRAVGLACPDQPLSVHLEAEPGTAERFRVVVAAADGEHPVAADIARRTRLVRGGEDAGLATELERLAGFMVAPRLLEALGGHLAVPDCLDRPALVLSFPVLAAVIASH